MIQTIKRILIIPIAFVHMAISLPWFVIIGLLFGMKKAKMFMDNIYLSWNRLF